MDVSLNDVLYGLFAFSVFLGIIFGIPGLIKEDDDESV